jgi:hypothetical protein
MMLRYSGDSCIYSSSLVDRDTIDEIIVSIKIYHRMDDIINIFGFVFLKHTLRLNLM